MISGLWNGISGVNSNQQALGVQSNNITNVNTVGYKSDAISFEDLIYENSAGNGTATQSIQKDFSQGNLKITGNNSDFAIDGNGFFIVQNQETGDTFYTRAGNFKMGTNGNLVTQNDELVHGLASGAPTAVATNANKTVFNNEFTEFLGSQGINSATQITSINAKATNYNATAADVGISGSGYKDANSLISDIDALRIDYTQRLASYSASPDAASVASVAQTTEIDYVGSLADLQTADDFVSLSIAGDLVREYFDTDQQTTMNNLSDKISGMTGLTSTVDANGLLTVTSLIPGEDVQIVDAKINDTTIVPSTTVAASVGSGLAMVESSRDALKSAIELAGAEFLELTNNIDTATEDTLTTTKIQLKLDEIGVSTEGFGEFEVNGGTIYMKQGDNSFVVGKLSTAFFNSVSGLNPEGGNNYSTTTKSGEAIYAGNINSIGNQELEMSNTDLGVGLTDLMVYQRAFEASAKSITTSDEFLKTAINLKN